MKKAACFIVVLLILCFKVTDVNAYVPNDPLILKQWYLEKANVYNAWDITKGSSDIIVAVIDSGVDIDHPDLIDNIWTNKDEIVGNGVDDDRNGYIDDVYGWDFVNSDNDVNPDIDISCISEKKCSLEGVNHGTVISGIIAGQQDNNIGISGIAPNVKIMALKVLNPNGGGNIEDVVNAIKYAKEKGATIINMSFVGTNDSIFLQQIMEEASLSNVIFTVAAGNYPGGGYNLNIDPMYPVCTKFNNKVSIGISAIDKNDKKPVFANYGSDCINFSAPGTSIFSTTVYKGEHSSFNNYYNGYWSGTSVATPIISGAIALIKSINPNLNNEEIFTILLDNSVDLGDKNLGRSIDVYKSVKYALENYNSNTDSFEIVASAGVGDEPLVNLVKNSGVIENSFLAYTKNFKGGVNAMSGDFDGDFDNEILTSPASSGGPHIRMFNKNGELENEFFAYPKTMTSGVNLASIDIDSDGEYEIVTSPVKNYESNIKIFGKKGNVRVSFLAYEKSFKGGVNIATCNLFNNGQSSIVTIPASAGGSSIKIFNTKGKLQKEFFAYNKNIKGNFSISCADVNSDGLDEIMVLNNSNISNNLYLDFFNVNGKNVKKLVIQKDANAKNYNVAFISSGEGNKNRIILSPRGSINPEIRIFDLNGKRLAKFYINNKKLNNGVNIAVFK